MNSGDLHLGGEAPLAISPSTALPFRELASSGEGLAGSTREGGVFEEVVNLESSVSREYSLPAYRSKLMTCCYMLHMVALTLQRRKYCQSRTSAKTELGLGIDRPAAGTAATLYQASQLSNSLSSMIKVFFMTTKHWALK